jgi:hypothetical protein
MARIILLARSKFDCLEVGNGPRRSARDRTRCCCMLIVRKAMLACDATSCMPALCRVVFSNNAITMEGVAQGEHRFAQVRVLLQVRAYQRVAPLAVSRSFTITPVLDDVQSPSPGRLWGIDWPSGFPSATSGYHFRRSNRVNGRLRLCWPTFVPGYGNETANRAISRLSS